MGLRPHTNDLCSEDVEFKQKSLFPLCGLIIKSTIDNTKNKIHLIRLTKDTFKRDFLSRIFIVIDLLKDQKYAVQR